MSQGSGFIEAADIHLASIGDPERFGAENRLFNHGDDEFIINNKDRIAQMILMPIIKIDLEESHSLPDSIRGEDGFGSTGK